MEDFEGRSHMVFMESGGDQSLPTDYNGGFIENRPPIK